MEAVLGSSGNVIEKINIGFENLRANAEAKAEKVGKYKTEKIVVDALKEARNEAVAMILAGFAGTDEEFLVKDEKLKSEIKRLFKVSDKELFRETELYDKVDKISGIIANVSGFVHPLISNAINAVSGAILGGASNTSKFEFNLSPEVQKGLEAELNAIQQIVMGLDNLVNSIVKQNVNGNLTKEQIVEIVKKEVSNIVEPIMKRLEEERNNRKSEQQNPASKENTGEKGSDAPETPAEDLGIPREENGADKKTPTSRNEGEDGRKKGNEVGPSERGL